MLGISDDWFKPVVPTIWVTPLLLAGLQGDSTCILAGRSSRRDSPPVRVPVEYQTANDSGALAMASLSI